MGQYKVPQNVEAEDKIVGPLTLKQFIYAIIGVVWGAVAFSLFRKVPVFFVVFGLPPAVIFLMLGLYQRQDQPFEALFLALVNFVSRPRRRVWEKEPVAEVFKIEPVKPTIEQAARDPREVRGQLEKLAKLVDTRGWSAKQPEIQEPNAAAEIDTSDRLVLPEVNLPEEKSIEAPGVGLQDDILDFQNNPNAQNLNELIEGAVQNIRQEAVQKMTRAAQEPPPAPAPAAQPVTQASTTGPTRQSQSVGGMTPNPLNAILKQALENSDLKVSQLAAQAKRQGTLKEGEAVKFNNA